MDPFKILLILIAVASVGPLCTLIMLAAFAKADANHDRHEAAGHPYDARAHEVMHLEQDLLEHDRRVREEVWLWDDTYSGDFGEDDGYL